MREKTLIRTAIFAAAAGGMAGLGCGSGETSDGGDVVLSIVGDKTVQVEAGASVELTARYHDHDRIPLAGEVVFSLRQAPDDVTLDHDVVVTDDIGAASIVVDTGASGDFDFEVVAEAPGAVDAVWEIAVDAIPPLDPSGAYDTMSSFNVASGLPGNVGRAVNLIIGITEGPGAPSRWIINQIIERLPESLRFNPPNSVVRAVNGALLSVAPGIVSRLLDAGDAFGTIATDFGVTTRLEIEGEPGDFTATHAITGFVLHYDSIAHEFSLAEVGVEQSKASDIAVTFDEEEQLLVIDEHELDTSYGTFLMFALEHFLLGEADGSLGDFLTSEIDCSVVAAELADQLGRGSIFEAAARTACNEGLRRAGDRIVDAFQDLDQVGMTLSIAGDAITQADENGRFVVGIEEGLWEGEFEVGGQTTALIRGDNSFDAERQAE